MRLSTVLGDDLSKGVLAVEVLLGPRIETAAQSSRTVCSKHPK